jgi:nucleoside-diphosphate-sugar epimerase
MRIVLAGATGVIGRELVPMLSGAGHAVVGLSRSQGTDMLDPNAVVSPFDTTRPDAIIHMATAIPASMNPRRMVRDNPFSPSLTPTMPPPPSSPP